MTLHREIINDFNFFAKFNVKNYFKVINELAVQKRLFYKIFVSPSGITIIKYGEFV